MAQQYTDRAYESCTVSGVGDVTLTGPILGYQILPTGDSVCVIEGMAGGFLNGEWEVVRGVRTGSTFTRDTIIDSSNNGNKVNFTDDAEIALVADSESFENAIAGILANTAAIAALFAQQTINTAGIAQNVSNIAQNVIDIAQNASDISDNADAIAQNALDIAQNADDIANLAVGVTPNSVSKIETDLQTMVGALELPDATLSALDELINANTVNAVFLYIPSIMDDDNGEWISSANWQSWYHEELNTATRGATREFPKAGVAIVAEANTVTLYDLGYSSLPMWMVFNSGGFWGGTWLSSNFNLLLDGASEVSTIVAKNGELYFGKVSSGVFLAGLKDDTGGFFRTSESGSTAYLGNISERNDGKTFTDADDLSNIINNNVNKLEITSDGNGKNIVYVFTEGGASRITTDLTVSNWTDTQASTNNVQAGSLSNGSIIFFSNTSSNALYGWIYPSQLPLKSDLWSNLAITGSPNQDWAAGRIPISYNGASAIVNSTSNFVFASTIALTKLYRNVADWGRSMVVNITHEFCSGIMHGDIRGAWLADTDNTDLVNTNLVTDGTFDSVCGVNWTCGADWNITGGQAIMASTSTYNPLTQAISGVKVGQPYKIEFDVIAITNNCKLDITGGISFVFSGTGAKEVVVIPTSTVLTLNFARSTSPSSMTIDNVSVIVEEADRSYNNNSLSVIGTIERNPVASDAELVSYGGFSSFNFLRQDYNADLTFLLNNFYIMGWVTVTSFSFTRILFDGRDAGLNNGILIFTDATEKLKLRLYEGGVYSEIVSTASIPLSVFMNFCFTVSDSGTLYYLYINGVYDKTISVTPRNLTATNSPVNIGLGISGSDPWTGEIALLRIGGGNPIAEQIKTINEEENRLFQPDTKCTLQGSSLNVKAIDHDEYNDLVTACSADHVTRFNGLVVVNDWVEIATSISTKADKLITGV